MSLKTTELMSASSSRCGLFNDHDSISRGMVEI